MKILIITSEELNPQNVFASSFELTQAKALKNKGHDVAIISLRTERTVLHIIKALFNKIILRKQIDDAIKNLIIKLYNNIYYFFIKNTETHLIDGIQIFEGLSVVKFLKRNNYSAYKQYLNMGLKIFHKYKNTLGLPDIIHAHSRFLIAPAIADNIYQKFGIPYVITEHSSYYSTHMLNKLENKLMRSAISNSKRFITVSKYLSVQVNRQLQNNSSNWLVIPNVLNPIFMEECEIHKNKKKIFLNVASLTIIKNHFLLIKSFKLVADLYNDCELRIIGNGQELNKCKLLVEHLNLLNKVIFFGYLNNENVRKEILECNTFILSSNYETFGVAIIEALACGKPVISTRCGGPEEIIDESNGLLVEKNNIEQLSEAMIYMIHNYKKYDSIAIRKDCLSKYGEEVITNRLINVYNEAVKS
ncbi:MAG: glycosyl transferase, group 1 [uncultured bacterium]|nr:MAG: glycosyl transferase, group 1 [uncultured bacterium]